MESGDERGRVPEIAAEASGQRTPFGLDVDGAVQPSIGGVGRRRGRSPSNREDKRLERMLKNRISAQQARDRNKAYMHDLEDRIKKLETMNAQLQQHISDLHNENQMLRKVLKNTTAG